jgi:hypothetical protein
MINPDKIVDDGYELISKALESANARIVELEALRKVDKSRCPCGDIILADTDDCKVPVCIECCIEISKAYLNMDQNYNEGFKRGMEAAKVDQSETELLKKEVNSWKDCARSWMNSQEKAQKRIEKLRLVLKSQLKWKPYYKNDDGSDPDICDAQSWDDVSFNELRDILVDVFTDARKALKADDKEKGEV